MAIKLLVLDVDGTLTDAEGRIGAANKSAVRTALAAGVEVALATGRPRQGVEAICAELGISGPLMLVNGALVLAGEEVWLEDYLAPADVEAVLAYGQAAGGLVLSTFQPEVVNLWVPPTLDRGWVLERFHSYSLTRLALAARVEDLPREQAAKAMFMAAEPATIARTLAGWPAKLDHLTCARSYPYLCEINSKSADKGRALRVVCERLGLAPAEVLAVGDGEIDLPMLELAGQGVFVARSALQPSLPPHVVVTPPGCEDAGVAWAVERFIAG
ncbi:MAG TPA: HAD-IIB family hydrolase [Firmicutes bacterium]|nr:HAD-IIB family hydrolase [Bacillota bacterium]